MSQVQQTTVIGSTARLRGELIATGDVLIEGQIDGAVTAEGSRVTIGSEARVRADITAQHIVVMGKIEGALRAADRVELRAGASVVGDVLSKRFSMEEEAHLQGRVGVASAEEQTPDNGNSGFVQQPPVQQSFQAESFAEPSESMAGRTFGQLPAGLAAAARTLEQQSTEPVGLSALVEEGFPRNA